MESSGLCLLKRRWSCGLSRSDDVEGSGWTASGEEYLNENFLLYDENYRILSDDLIWKKPWSVDHGFWTQGPNLVVVVKITSDDLNTLDLTEYRLHLLKAAAENVLKISGYKIRNTFESKWIHFAKENSRGKSNAGAKVNILCGPVVNSQTKKKETVLTTSDYHKLRLRDMFEMSEKKKSETSNELVECLADSCVKMTLLQTKSNQAVSLNLSTIETASRETASKGAGFLQYNASRMAAIRKKYDSLVAEGLYTAMPEPGDLNFEVLKEPEEWALLFNFLLEYPSLISKISEGIIEGRANIHIICNFLSRLCSLFSAYYRRVRILLEPKVHLFPTIHARLVLIMSVEQVLENGLAIMNIKKIEKM